MEKIQIIKDYCRQFKLSGISKNFEQVLQKAQTNQISYLDYMAQLFEIEANTRHAKSIEKQLKFAGLPLNHDLENYDYTVVNGISKTQLNQLRELTWVDQIYNVVFMGPSGTGKTYLSSGLCFDAVNNGYKAYFRTMDELVNMLKMKEYTRSEMADYKRLLKANLMVIDDIMLFPMDKQLAVIFFNFINQLFEKTSFIITTNKSPKQWAQMLDDEILATALLDRLLYRCQVINLDGKSYRMKNRKTIFNNE
ncbi:MAG: IS21-like element helper ATPase IstB [Bacteroidales bacterium]|nr:IS21-like element helper ATPase IstB [Bacteroidales bacterium]